MDYHPSPLAGDMVRVDFNDDPKFMGYAYPQPIFSDVHNPADSTIYSIAAVVGAPILGTTAYRCFVPIDSMVRYVTLGILVAGVLGSGELGALDFLLNDSEVTSLTTVLTWNNVFTPVSITTDPPITLRKGDFYCLRISTPAWATNPTSVIYYGGLWMEPVIL